VLPPASPRCPQGRLGDEDMTPTNTTIDYKVCLFLHLYSNFDTIHLVPHVHVFI
jgi:hypothetical protein